MKTSTKSLMKANKGIFNAWQPGCTGRWVLRFCWSFFHNFGGGPSFLLHLQQPPLTGFSQYLPACLMPESFNLRIIWGNLTQPHICWAGIAHVHVITDLNILRSDSKAMHFISFQNFLKITVLNLTFWRMFSTKIIPPT